MMKIELDYNPYLLETFIQFNGQEPKINSLVEKYKNCKLQTWLAQLPKIFHDEMNGYEFEIDFSGTKIDYEELQKVFEEQIALKQISLFHKNELETAAIKSARVNELLHWLSENPSRRFDNKAFRAKHIELLDKEYVYVLIQCESVNFPLFEGIDLVNENVYKVEELPKNLTGTPILFSIEEDMEGEWKEFLENILKHPEVVKEQLFFLISKSLNVGQIQRTIKDLGIARPQTTQKTEDLCLLVKKYIEIYTITDYIGKSISAFREEIKNISFTLEKENEKNRAQNIMSHEKIENLEKTIQKLEDTQEHFVQRDNFKISPSFEIEKSEIVKKIQEWRKKSEKINDDEKAKRMIAEFTENLKKYFNEFVQKSEHLFYSEKQQMQDDFWRSYQKADCHDNFKAIQKNSSDFSKYAMPDLTKELMALRKEEMIEKPRTRLDFLSPNKPTLIEMTLQISYYCKEWRDKALESIMPIMKEIIEKCSASLEELYNDLANEYIVHLKELIEKHTTEKEVLLTQLSSEERALQKDKDWLNAFKNQLRQIERG